MILQRCVLLGLSVLPAQSWPSNAHPHLHGTDQRAVCTQASLSLARFLLPSCSHLLSPPVTRSWSSLWALFAWQFMGPGFSRSSNQPSLVDTVFLCLTPMVEAPLETNRGSCPLHESSQFCSAFLGRDGIQGWKLDMFILSYLWALCICSPLECRHPLACVLDLPLFLVDSLEHPFS